MVDGYGATREPYAGVASSLAQMGPEDVSARASRLARAFMDQGVTFDLDGEERPFPLDVVPRIFTAAEWTKVSDGVAQRVRALELFLADVYGAARIVSDGLIPHEVVTSSPGFVRAAYGLVAAERRADPRGRHRRRFATRTASSACSRTTCAAPRASATSWPTGPPWRAVLPELFWGQPIQMVTDYPAHLINALRRAAPDVGGRTPPSWS